MPRRVVASTYVTLDGFVDEPGRWSGPFWSDEAAEFKREELFATDALLLGRVTYEGFAKAWPAMEGTGDFGERMNALPKYVASRTLASAAWNATIMAGDVADAVRQLKDGGDGLLVIHGSGQLVDYLTAADLVDEYRLMVHPIVLGNGTKRLFAEAPRRTLRFIRTFPLPNGINVQTYEPDRTPTTKPAIEELSS
jgi:dihydrofolate reductase